MRRSRLSLRAGFESYLNASLARTTKVKTLLSADEAIDVDAIYVPLSFSSGSRLFTDTEIASEFELKKRVLVIGTAGGGKSMFLKKFYIDLIKNRRLELPIFFELRAVNNQEEKSLFESIFTSLHSHVTDLNFSDFQQGIRVGKFLLILDGFDEIDHDKRRKHIVELNELCETYPDARVIMTARPQDELTSLQSFVNFKVNAMSKEQTIILLEKLDYDIDSKTLFIEHVDQHLFEDHYDFLSIPLLASMMLLTFSQYSDIPSKIHIFYQQAFEILFLRHDRSKGGAFTRKSHTGLSIDVFQRTFSYFCASSYVSQDFTFSYGEIIDWLTKSLRYGEVNATADSFLNDLTQSTCLLHKDGTEYTFAHRSFQEYFTAVFISRLSGRVYFRGVNSVVQRVFTDDVIPMLHDLDPDSFERNWAQTVTKGLLAKLSRHDPRSEASKHSKQLFSSVALCDDKIRFSMETKQLSGAQLLALSRVYRSEFQCILDDAEHGDYKDFYDKLQEDRLFRDMMARTLPVEEFENWYANRTERFGEYPLTIPQMAYDVLGITNWLLKQREVIRDLHQSIRERGRQKTTNLNEIFG